MNEDERRFGGLPLEEAITSRAAACGIVLAPGASQTLALHARAVLEANERLHLTSITEPGEFLERHLGEAFEGAAVLPADLEGTLLDLGSGNGYPALPLVAARPGMRPILVEASRKKAAFLDNLLRERGLLAAKVLARHVQRASDLEDIGSARVITVKAVGGWAKLLPKIVPVLQPDGVVLLWAGQDVENVRRRTSWKRLRLETVRPLPGRERSAVWVFRASLRS